MLLHTLQALAERFGWRKKGRLRPAPSALPRISRRATLGVEMLEDRTNPSPFSSTGALGNLIPTTMVEFDTTIGQYRVDGGGWQGGGVLSADPSQSTMLYNFAQINLASNVQVVAFGIHSLGLLGTTNIYVYAEFNFQGQNGQAGADGYGIVGGGGGSGQLLPEEEAPGAPAIYIPVYSIPVCHCRVVGQRCNRVERSLDGRRPGSGRAAERSFAVWHGPAVGQSLIRRRSREGGRRPSRGTHSQFPDRTIRISPGHPAPRAAPGGRRLGPFALLVRRQVTLSRSSLDRSPTAKQGHTLVFLVK